MKKTGRMLAAGILALVGSLTANALNIDTSTTPQWTTDDNANLDAGDVAALVGSSCDLVEVYKQDVGASGDTGAFAGSYSTEFFNTPLDPQDATISYDGGPSITGTEIYLVVKDGKQSPAQYLFDISSWNGTDDIVMTGFWGGEQGGISHVALYTCEGTSVPDGGTTLVMLGLSSMVLGMARKRNRRT